MPLRLSQFGQSPQSAPLLASAQTPGVSQSRLSETSLASGSYERGSSAPGYDSSNYGPSANMGPSAATASGPRYGPSATASPQSSTMSRIANSEQVPLRGGAAGMAGGAAAGGVMAGVDDDDLDDQLHTFTAADRKDLSSPFTLNSWRGWANGFTLFVLLAGFVVLFAGYPIISHYADSNASSGSSTSGYNLGGINASGQYPEITNFPTLIDADTPSSALTRTGTDGNKWTLVFSDEFEREGRTFYDGDDPFFTAVDIHYWPTNDFEWYDPSAITTKDGHLLITLSQEPTNDLMFKSGMLQSWNQLCFNKNAYFEVSVSLPGVNYIGGFWPGIWTMGNLGRPGYGASTEGLWPYTYSSCDVGILPNQTYTNGTGPTDALTTGTDGTALSYLPGQRLSACNCDSSTHPGPVGVGRGAVEIDLIEAQIDLTNKKGQVSQSAQVAPFDDYWQFNNCTDCVTIYDSDLTYYNTYLGGVYQQSVSGLTYVDSSIYYGTSAEFGTFGFEFVSNFDDPTDGYIEWVSMGKASWRMNAKAVAANSAVGLSQRVISQEPMALIFNLGMSNNFENVDFDHMPFPNYMRIDYIRVYQLDGGDGSIGCDPSDRPTADYISTYAEVYANPNLTTWAGAGYTFPTNKMGDPTC